MENLEVQDSFSVDEKQIYDAALATLSSHLKVIDSTSSDKYHIIGSEKRIKSLPSIKNKLMRDGVPFSYEAARERLHDIVGYRIICLDEDDVEIVIDLLRRTFNTSDGIKILCEKDYITNPKQSGYRSYHMIVEIPVYLPDKVERIKTEIQIRTLSMHIWSAVEHEVVYKNDDVSEETGHKMQQLSLEFNYIENYLRDIRKKIYQARGQDKKTSYAKNLSLNQLKEYRRIIKRYKIGQEFINSYINSIISQYEDNKDNGDIQGLPKFRIKSVESTAKKLNEKGLSFNKNNIIENILDIVGCRIVCLSKDDVYALVDIIRNTPGIQILEEKNYIDNPKENGYRSYHIKIVIPVPYYGKLTYVPAEIQIRTVMMHLWASEQRVAYELGSSEETKTVLRELSETVNDMEDQINELSRVHQKGNGTAYVKK